MKLHPKAFGLTCGLFAGAGLFTLTWLALWQGDFSLNWVGNFYLGYQVSPLGSVIGLVWAFLDALVGGFCFALIYNYLAQKWG